MTKEVIGKPVQKLEDDFFYGFFLMNPEYTSLCSAAYRPANVSNRYRGVTAWKNEVFQFWQAFTHLINFLLKRNNM